MGVEEQGKVESIEERLAEAEEKYPQGNVAVDDGYLARHNRVLELREKRFKDEKWMSRFGHHWTAGLKFRGEPQRELSILCLEYIEKGVDTFGGVRGKPKGKRKFSTIFAELLGAIPVGAETEDIPPHVIRALETQLERPVTRADLMSFRMIQKAIVNADVSAFNAVLDRAEGKAVQRNENLNANLNYTDFLDSKVAESDGVAPDSTEEGD